MMSARNVVALLATLAGGMACGNEAGPTRAETALLATRTAQVASRAAPGSGLAPDAPIAMWILPRELREVSGLALTADGRLLTHNDQRGRVFVINPRSGAILKRFFLGDLGVRADFEGIAVGPESIYMIASNGDVYEFDEGKNDERIKSTLHDTRLGKECEFEGIAYDPANKWLLMPCKNVGMKNLSGQVVIYRWQLGEAGAPRQLPMLTIPVARLIGDNDWKTLRPTDITIEPTTGHYVLITQEKALIEITPSGELVRSLPIPGRHPQPEGVAITPDGILIVADESTKSSAFITLYRWPPGTASRAPG